MIMVPHRAGCGLAVAVAVAAAVVVAWCEAQALAQAGPPASGCFVDHGAIGSGQKGRQMEHQVCELTGMCAELTRESCAAACRGLGHTLYGVEAGHQCYCDNSIANASATLDAETHCRVQCAGDSICQADPAERCGGAYEIWVGAVKGMPEPGNCT